MRGRLLVLADPDVDLETIRENWCRLEPNFRRGFPHEPIGARLPPAWHTLAPLIAWNARRFGIPTPDLEAHRLRAIAEDARAQALLERVLAAAACSRTPVLLLKGEHLARTVYPRTWLRPRCDIDLLVPRTRARGLIRALARQGFRPDEREFSLDHALRAKDEVALLPPEPFAITVELHWRSAWLPAWSRRVGVRGMWRRAVEIGPGLYGLSPEDLGIYLCLHLAKHGYGGNPIWLLDLALWRRKGGADPRRFHQRAARLGLGRIVGHALASARGEAPRPAAGERAWEPVLDALRQPDLEARLHALRRLVLPPEHVLRRLYPEARKARPWMLAARRWLDLLSPSAQRVRAP